MFAKPPFANLNKKQTIMQDMKFADFPEEIDE